MHPGVGVQLAHVAVISVPAVLRVRVFMTAVRVTMMVVMRLGVHSVLALDFGVCWRLRYPDRLRPDTPEDLKQRAQSPRRRPVVDRVHKTNGEAKIYPVEVAYHGARRR